MRTFRATVVPVGVVLFHEAVFHATAPPPSKTRERKLAEALYGVTRIQSTTTVPPPTLASLAKGRRLLLIAMPCEATSVPSIE
jgi:hypothetical protein